MTQVLRGNIVHAPKMGELSILEHGYMVLEDGVIRGVYPTLPEELAQAEVRDYGDRLLMQSFADMHLHAPQYPMLGTGMDLPLLDWLNAYHREVFEKLAPRLTEDERDWLAKKCAAIGC